MPVIAPMSAPVRIFVSHHHSPQEDAFTAQLVADLQGAGARVWVDVADIHEGDFLQRINTALASTDWVVVVLTPAAVRSQPVNTEVNAAINLVWQQRMRGVIPIVAQACDPTEIPPTWATLQRYDATHAYHAALAGLLRALGLAIASATPATPSGPVALPAVPPAQTLPSLGPAPAPAGATSVHHLTPVSLHSLGFRGYTVGGVECILPPVCPVPSGVFPMGTDPAYDTEVYDDETPQHPVRVGDFAIGQYPVTVAEYACAVRATAGRATAVREPPAHEFGGTTTDWTAQLAALDHPVVCVSWQDAAAYAWWLSGVTQQAWRLPTEAEWEKMARWDARTSQARIYPWGDTFDAARCNSAASGIDTTTALGRYPSDVSPYGAQDVAGNVYEWTSSLYRPYPYQHGDGREDQLATDRRVLRGGSWTGARGSRTASRTVDLTPDSLSDDIGFRLALSPVGFGSA